MPLLDALLIGRLGGEPRVVGAVHVLVRTLLDPRVREDLRVLRAVQHHLGAVVTLVGDVEAQRLELIDHRGRCRCDLDQRRLRLGDASARAAPRTAQAPPTSFKRCTEPFPPRVKSPPD